MMKVTKCNGEGQSSCKGCSDKGKFNRNWDCFFFQIEGLPGRYCSDCVKEITEEKMSFEAKLVDAFGSKEEVAGQ